MVIIDEHDVGKSREQLLMDLIYETNGARIPLDKIRFGKPREVDPRIDLDDDPNTFIPAVINPEYDNRFPPSEGGFMYRRRSLALYVEDKDFSAITPLYLPFKISDLLEEINSVLPYGFQIEELVDHEYTTVEQVEKGIVIEARKDAYIWFSKVKAFINTSKISGGPLISNVWLNGFNAYEP